MTDVENPSTVEYHYMGAEEVISSVQSSQVTGLLSGEAELRVQKYGPNILPEGRKETLLEKIWKEVNSVLIYVLLVGAALSFAFNHIPDGVVILGVIIVNVSVSLYMENQADQTSERLKEMMSLSAAVLRDGQKNEVPSKFLTIGDIVLLQSGDIVPADGRIITSTNFQVLESALTGESVAVLKTSSTLVPHGNHQQVSLAERTNMVFSGTQVLKGTCTMVVTSIGQHSEIGKINAILNAVEHMKTPLMIQLDVFAKYLAFTIISLAIIALLVAIGRSYSVQDAFSFAIGIAVAAIPEGLPSVVTITFAIGVRYMALRRAIIKTLPAVETLGSVSVICSDKTGTLTQNLMTVTSATNSSTVFDFTAISDEVVNQTGAGNQGLATVHTLVPGIFCNDSTIKRKGEPISLLEQEYEVKGDPTESCIFSAAIKVLDAMDTKERQNFVGSSDANSQSINGAGAMDIILKRYPRLAEIPFDSSVKYMATLHAISAEDCKRWLGLPESYSLQSTVHIIFVKGAPERILSMTSENPAAWQVHGEEFANRGMRVLGTAYRILPPSNAPGDLKISEADIFTGNKDFIMCSLIGIIDPPRPEAIAAVHSAQEAGIAVKMITGDHPTTAVAIARQMGIFSNPVSFGESVSREVRARTRTRSFVQSHLDNHKQAITGTDLDVALGDSDKAFDLLVANHHVFARTTPEHKLKIVQSLQRQGIVCSMTGDGVNDAPALKAANIGVAMGITGTGVAKEAAKIVVTDDNFATIVEAIRIGRCTYHNLIKILAFVLPTNGGQAFSIIMALVLGLQVPITALQILWVNMVTSITLGLVLAFEKPHPEIMNSPPRRSTKPVFGKFLAWRLLFVTVVLVLAVLGNFAWEKADHPSYSEDHLRTIAVNTLSVCQVAYLFSCRNLRSLANPYRTFVQDSREVWCGVLAVAAFQAIFTYAPPFQYIFRTKSLDGWSWGKCILLGFATFCAVEIEKVIGFHTMHIRKSLCAKLHNMCQCHGYVQWSFVKSSDKQEVAQSDIELAQSNERDSQVIDSDDVDLEETEFSQQIPFEEL